MIINSSKRQAIKAGNILFGFFIILIEMAADGLPGICKCNEGMAAMTEKMPAC
jgi:hypothetical protein